MFFWWICGGESVLPVLLLRHLSSSLCHLLFNHFQFALIHGPNIPGSYAILLFTASKLPSITSPIHNWVLFLVWLHPFILSGVISPLISSSILVTYRPGEFIFQCPIFLRFHSVHGVLKENTEVVCHSSLQWTTFCHSSSPWPIRLGWPQMAWLIVSLSWTRLWSMWSDWLVVCVQTLNKPICHIKTQNIDIHSVCPMCAYTLTTVNQKCIKMCLLSYLLG